MFLSQEGEEVPKNKMEVVPSDVGREPKENGVLEPKSSANFERRE